MCLHNFVLLTTVKSKPEQVLYFAIERCTESMGLLFLDKRNVTEENQVVVWTRHLHMYPGHSPTQGAQVAAASASSSLGVQLVC